MMQFSLIICTYKRAESLLRLLASVKNQTRLPYEIIIIDGSPDDKTANALKHSDLKLIYHKVQPDQRGLTRQRNMGISLVSNDIDIVCFLDDDIALKENYFQELISTYKIKQDAVAVGGYIINEIKWEKVSADYISHLYQYTYDNFLRKDGSRFVLRKKLGLDADRPPAHLPKFSHGRSVGFLPPTGKTYGVEQFMGGVSSYRREVFDKIQFSTYFEGYGLYEDADFCFRLLKLGKLYVNTSAQCEHHHHPSGRPNQFQYGQMVTRNGWYVWRLRWPEPGFKNKLKWHATILLLAFVRLGNAAKGAKKKQALTDGLGRLTAWLKLFFTQPKIQR